MTLFSVLASSTHSKGTVAANFASNDLKVKTAAIIIDSSSDYAKGLAACFQRVL